MNDGRVHDRTRRDAHPLFLQVQIHRLQHLSAQLVLFQQVAKLAHRGLVRHRLLPQIDAHKLPQHRRVVQRLFHRRIRQVEPLLQKINPQHPLHSHRRPSIAGLRIVRLNQPAQPAPGHHLLHLFQKQCTLGLLGVPLKASHHRQCPLFHAGVTLTYTPVERESLIRVSLALNSAQYQEGTTASARGWHRTSPDNSRATETRPG